MADYTLGLLIFSGILAVVAVAQAIILWRTVTTARASERAYVKMSHERPGVQFASGSWFVTSKTINYGRTPADVTDIHVTRLILPIGDNLPVDPPYNRGQGNRQAPRAFLVTQDRVFTGFGGPLSDSELSEIRAGFVRLYIFGYVDYVDRFKKRHRAGYARMYQPGIDIRQPGQSLESFAKRTNLVFVPQRGYNYDRARLRGEGNDWNQNA
jgi:hypothetical protein